MPRLYYIVRGQYQMGWIPYPAVIVGWCPLNDGADKKGLIAVDLLLTSDDTEAQAAWSTPPQDNVFAAVEMPARSKGEIKNTNYSNALYRGHRAATWLLARDTTKPGDHLLEINSFESHLCSMWEWTTPPAQAVTIQMWSLFAYIESKLTILSNVSSSFLDSKVLTHP